MNRSSNAIDGALASSIKVNKQEDGSYKAQALGSVGQAVEATVGRSESEAVNLLKQSIQKAVASGKL